MWKYKNSSHLKALAHYYLEVNSKKELIEIIKSYIYDNNDEKEIGYKVVDDCCFIATNCKFNKNYNEENYFQYVVKWKDISSKIQLIRINDYEDLLHIKPKNVLMITEYTEIFCIKMKDFLF